MSALIEHGIEIHWIHFPAWASQFGAMIEFTFSYSTNILIESSYDSDVARSRLSRNPSMRNPKGPLVENN